MGQAVLGARGTIMQNIFGNPTLRAQLSRTCCPEIGLVIEYDESRARHGRRLARTLHLVEAQGISGDLMLFLLLELQQVSKHLFDLGNVRVIGHAPVKLDEIVVEPQR